MSNSTTPTVIITLKLSSEISPLGARLIKSPARIEISSSDAAEKSYSALATTWSSSPLAQLLAKRRKQKNLVNGNAQNFQILWNYNC